MDERMTLEQVRDWHREKGKLACCDRDEEKARLHDAMFNAIDTHLTQPAQAVDVVAWRYRLPNHPWCFTEKQPADYVSDAGVEVEPLTRAIGNAQAEVRKMCACFTEGQRAYCVDRDKCCRPYTTATPPTQATQNAHE